MASLDIPQEFLKDFPKTLNANVTKQWTNAIIAAVGIHVCEGNKMTMEQQRARFLAEYKEMVPTFCNIFAADMPDNMELSGALMRSNFSIGPSGPTMWDGNNLQRKFATRIRTDIVRDSFSFFSLCIDLHYQWWT